MRPLLLLICTFVASVVGAGVIEIILILTLGAKRFDGAYLRIGHDGLLAPIPIVAALAAGIFVYRHTARLRKTQAAVTISLVLLLTFAALIALFVFNI